MAKHSKGKHTAKAVKSSGFSSRKEKKKKPEEEPSGSNIDNSSASEDKDNNEADEDEYVKIGKHGVHSGSGSKKDPKENEDAEGDGDKDDSDDGSSEDLDEEFDEEEDLVEDDDAGAAQPVAVAMAPVQIRKTRKGLRRLGIACGILVILLIAAYFGGVVFFWSHYLPNTNIAGIDFSLKEPNDMKQMLDERVGNYAFHVEGNGLDFDVTAEEADVSSDSDAASKAVLESTSPWMWPVEVFKEHDATGVLASAISAKELASIVNAQVEKLNETAKAPKDAVVKYDKESQSFVIKPEVPGTVLVPEGVLAQVLAGVLNLEDSIEVLDDALAQPAVFQNDKRLIKAANDANELIKAKFALTVEGNKITEITPDITNKWVSIDRNFEAKFDKDALKNWSNKIAESCNTVGSERKYTRKDGKEITVNGGTYGWKVDSEELAKLVTDAVLAGEKKVVVVPVLQSGSGFDTLGGRDWGDRYVDVDLSEQYARFYDKNGKVIWKAAFVSGNPNTGHATPQGVWYVNGKESPSTLIGQIINGKPEYKTKVQYWMPFEGNDVGFHDATWQSSFGGSRYTYNGSHGCINLSYEDAEKLYGLIEEGDVVVVHG